MIDLCNIKDYTTEKPNGWSLLGDENEFDKLPPLHKQQIYFLDNTASKFIYEFLGNAHILTGEPHDPFAKSNFKIVERFSYFMNNDEGIRDLKKWLYQRGIPFRASVYVLPIYDGCPILTNWKMVIKYAADFFIHDDVTVFDNTLNWCLYYHHDNYLLFGKNNIYDSTEDEKMMKDALERRKKFSEYKPPYY
jgi:hypothetical protein